MTKFQKIMSNPVKDIAFSTDFCYNKAKFADSMHAIRDKRLPTPSEVPAETLIGPPRDGKRAKNTPP